MVVAAVTALYVPGDRPERFDKAVAAGPDIVIIDLEDAVAPSAKPYARSAVAEYLASGGRPCAVHVRVNGRQTPWWADDLAALAGLPGLAGLRLAKVESADDVRTAAGAVGGVSLHPLVESAVGVEALAEIARSGVGSVELGEADLASDLGVQDDSVLDWVRARLVVATRAAALPPPMMSVWTALADLDGLARSCGIGRRRGFVGRTAIHPRQLPVIRSAFTPTQVEVDRARTVLDALAGAADAGGGVAVLADGSMVDAAMREGAERVIALAERLGQRP